MPKKKNSDAITRKAWNLLRLALLWARKGGLFKRRLMVDLRVAAKFIRNVGHTTTPRDRIFYGERQLSFDKTPVFHVKMHRPASMRYLIPCLTPQDVDFDYDFDDCDDNGRKSFLKDYEEDQEEDEVRPEEEGIDLRAEEFIAKFYQQMKMQRQISYLEYNERLSCDNSSS